MAIPVAMTSNESELDETPDKHLGKKKKTLTRKECACFHSKEIINVCRDRHV